MNFYLLIDNLFIREGIKAILASKYPSSEINLLSDIEELSFDLIEQSSIFISNDPHIYYNYQPKISNLIHKKDLKTILLANTSQLLKLKDKSHSILNAIIYVNCSYSELEQALSYIQSGINYRCRKMNSDISCQADFESFLQNQGVSSREYEIIKLVIDGLNSKEIADKLTISYNTVTTHRRNINKKLSLKRPNDLMRMSLLNTKID
ncbi:MAG: helix-turn-helix transcriptional regulator [Bacteroidia bacterium]|nr:helix-turn-helix transcriptional regulator [Bacteroidia bacterium]